MEQIVFFSSPYFTPVYCVTLFCPTLSLTCSVSGATAAGACSTDSYQRVPLAFGVDTLAVCTVPLTAVQVRMRVRAL